MNILPINNQINGQTELSVKAIFNCPVHYSGQLPVTIINSTCYLNGVSFIAYWKTESNDSDSQIIYQTNITNVSQTNVYTILPNKYLANATNKSVNILFISTKMIKLLYH